MSNPVPECIYCQHFPGEPGRYINVLPTTCTAFPEGIPSPILSGEVTHFEPFPGDHGLRFQPFEGQYRTYRVGARYVPGACSPRYEIERLRRHLEQHGDDTEAILRLAHYLAELRRLPEAIAELRQAMEDATHYSWAYTLHLTLADYLWRSGQAEEALTVQRKAIDIEPENPRVFLLMGDVLAHLGRIVDARAAWQRCLALCDGCRPEELPPDYADLARGRLARPLTH